MEFLTNEASHANTHTHTQKGFLKEESEQEKSNFNFLKNNFIDVGLTKHFIISYLFVHF